MTEKNSTPLERAGNDHEPYDFEYDHGRMPFFMKLVWVGFIILATFYIVQYLLAALSEEVGG